MSDHARLWRRLGRALEGLVLNATINDREDAFEKAW